MDDVDECDMGMKYCTVLVITQVAHAAVAENAPIVRRCLEDWNSMLTAAIPDVEISAVRLFKIPF